jgi:hypothetical protein
MAYSKAKLKSGGDRASPCFRPFWIGKLSDKCLPIWTLLYVSVRYVNITVMIVDIIHCPVFYLKPDVSKTGIYLHLQVEPTQFGPINIASISLSREVQVPPEDGDRIQSPKHCVLCLILH